MNHLFVEIRLLTLYCYLALCSIQAMQLATTSSTTTTTSSATTTITITSTITSNTSHHLIPATTTTTTTTTNVQTELPLIQPASISTATASTSSQEPQPPPQAQPQPRPTEPTTTPETTNSQPPPTEQQQQLQPQQPYCTLGDDTYQIGERWNPNLPPFGVQVCVLCECTVRQRKSCYEAKVTCRRITNECPIIDSCPDGKKPVTVAGQCCKSCQSTSLSSSLSSSSSSLQEQAQSIGNQSPAYESQPQLKPAPLSTSFRIVYMNERTKDYMSLVKNLPACPMRDSDSSSASSGGPTTTKPPSPPQLPQQVSPSLLLLPTTQAPMQAPSASKAAKANRNDLNGIDTRMAFKSLHDAASNYIGSSKSRHSSSSSTFSSDASAAAVNYNQQHEGSAPRRFDHSSDDHQHPNDVQSATASNRNQQQLHHHHSSANYGSVGSGGSNSRQSSSSLSSSLANSCKLGNDTFQVGDVWNPILPPHGVQVCVQCNCIFRVRKGCFETKVTCRRINRDCPNLEVCPDGNPPINVDGQCCKTCPMSIGSNTDNQQDEQQQQREQLQQQSDGSANLFQPTTLPLNGIMRNEKVFREFNASTRNLNLCVKSKESVDIYNTNRYARRAQRQALTTPRHTSNNNK